MRLNLMLPIRDLLSQPREFDNAELFSSILQPPPYRQSLSEYEFYLGRDRRRRSSWVLLQPEFKGIDL